MAEVFWVESVGTEPATVERFKTLEAAREYCRTHDSPNNPLIISAKRFVQWGNEIN